MSTATPNVNITTGILANISTFAIFPDTLMLIIFQVRKLEYIAEEQNGFRAGRSCVDHLFVLCTIIRNRKMLGQDTFLCFVDFKKAFDSVDRNLLPYKLFSIGVTGNMYWAITSLFANPRSRVILEDHATDYFNCPLGVKQGDSLSPTLFAVFINDLADTVKNSGIGIEIKSEDISGLVESTFVNILLYADDIVLLSEDELDM